MAVRVGGAARYNKVAFDASAAPLQALLSGGQKEIILGSGTYTLDTGLTVPSGVTLRGEGPQATILAYNNAGALAALLTLASGAHVRGIKLVQAGAGAVTNGILTSGNDVCIRDMILDAMALRIANTDCSVEGNRVIASPEGIVVTGERNHVIHNIISNCVRGIYLSGGLRNIIESNSISGDASSSRGIHADGVADFNVVGHNIIKDIQLGTPGRGIDWEASGASNLVKSNIFSGTFGTKAILVDPSVPATTQFAGNLTIGALPPSARLVSADLGGAHGLGNT